MSKNRDCKVFGAKVSIDIIDRLDRLFYTKKLDGTAANKGEFVEEIFTEYLESKGF